ncbi:putative ABC transporter expressed in the mitochondrial inner membrane [Echria macrotheca]|uniref:ABC transporter expressed in the mitochondrial inner membrane n=1 Tax=Echria macrotheca TaxID=438768 RepID=A0AAJ0B7I6_9PEZI|nr:putative ABC transporter expressed in the mitochondrial inner membrane [Echria macrotheca]
MSGVATEKAPADVTKSSFSDLFVFTRRYHLPIVVCAFVTAALVAGARTAYAVFVGTIFEIVTRFGAGQLQPDDFFAQISRWAGYLCLLGLGMWLVATIDTALWVLTGELRARTAREKLFGAFLRKTMSWYDSRENGMSSLMVGIQTQIRELQMATSQTLGFLVFEVFVFVACIGLAFYFSFKLTLVMLATGLPSAAVLWLISHFLDPAIAGQNRELAEASKHATAATTAIDLVKVYNGQDHEAFQFVSAIRRSARFYGRQVVCNCAQMSYIKFWMIMLFVIGFYFAVVLSSRGEITPGNALTTFYAVLIAFQSLEALGPQWLILAKGMAAGQLLDALVAGQKGHDGEPVDKVSGLFSPCRCHGEIAMSNVSFAYPSNPTNLVLSPSDFHFPAGQLTFVVGRSGSGKSTLANLLLRFYEPRTGSITLDGHPVQSLDLDWLRHNVLLVQQSSVLFNDTFFNNVAFGAGDPETVSPARVQEACNMALLQSTISGMPDGLETPIGPNGYSLSGGQRQRLALARAKLRDPPVLILDEVTSGLDPVGRTLIMDAIRMWRRDKTTIIITHEVGHIEPEEYVYVMEDGDIVQEGFQKGLLAEENGLFASLLASADDASSSGRSSLSSSDDEGSEFEGDDIAERRPSGLLYSFGLDTQVTSGLFHRLSLPVEPPMTKGAGHRFLNLPVGSRRGSLARKSSEAAAMAVIAETGREVQNSRTQHERRTAHEREMAAAAASMDSLDLFFLERLAKPRDKKHDTPAGPRLPSLTAILKTVWPTLDGHGKVQLVIGLCCCGVIAGSDVAFAFIFAKLLTSFWQPAGQHESGTRWASILTGVAAIDGLATFFAYYLMEHVAQKWINTLRAEAISRILAQPKSWFDKARHSPSRIAQCLDRSAEEMRKLVGMFVPVIVTVVFLISASIIWALIIRWDLTLVTLAGLPVALGTARANSLVAGKWESACDAAAATTGSVFSDTFSNIRVVRALTLEKYFSTKHTRSAAATYRVGAKRAVAVGLFHGLHQSMSYFITALVFFFGARILSRGETSVTDVLRVMNLLLFSLGTSVAMLANVPQMAAAKATAVQVLHLAHLDRSASHEVGGDERVVASPLPIRMTNLRFAYPSSPGMEVLHNINLEIRPGTCTAIVGASGCGKSTLASLLLRLYAPLEEKRYHTPTLPPLALPYESPRPPPDPASTSALTYAARPASSLSTPSLRGRMAYVPQQPFLFPTSIRENITYGLHDSSPLRAQAFIEDATRAVGIHDFIVSLPRGYETSVGEGGQALSGGQMQRVALARAILRRPDVLVLDEPTSALDAAGAEAIRGLIQGLVSEGRMAVVVVTHSKEMMRAAGEVVMVEGGRVVEMGEYEELAGRGGRFAQLVGGGVWVGPSEVGKERKKKGRGREEALRQLQGDDEEDDKGKREVMFREVRY